MPVSRMSRAAAKTKIKDQEAKVVPSKPQPAEGRSKRGAGAEREPATEAEPEAERARRTPSAMRWRSNPSTRISTTGTSSTTPSITRRASTRFSGIAPEQMRTPKDWTDRVHPDDQPLFKYTLAEHLKGNTPRFSMELRYRDGAGNWRWARQAGIAVRGAGRPGPSHGRRRGRHHRGQARRRGDDRFGRRAQGDEPLDLRTADRARHAGGSATRLCEADAALIFRRENGHYRLAAQHGLNRGEGRRSCAAGRSRRAAHRWSAAPRWNAASSTFRSDRRHRNTIGRRPTRSATFAPCSACRCCARASRSAS